MLWREARYKDHKMYGNPIKNIRDQTFGVPITPGRSSTYGVPYKNPNLILDFDVDYGLIISNNKAVRWTDRISGVSLVSPTIESRPTVVNNINYIKGLLFDGAFTYMSFEGKIPEFEGAPEITVIRISGGKTPGAFGFTPYGGGLIYQVKGNSGNGQCISMIGNVTFAGEAYILNVRDDLTSNLDLTGKGLGGQLSIDVLIFKGSEVTNADRIQGSINGGGRINGTTNVIRQKMFVSKSFERCQFNIGAFSNATGLSPNGGYAGVVSRILVYNKALSINSAELKGIIDTIKTKNNFISSRQIIAIGDSRTADSNHPTTDGWCEQMAKILGPQAWIVQNAGLDGETLTLALTRQTDKIISSIGSYNSQIYLVWLGFNDFAQNAHTAATIYGDLKTYCQNIKTAAPNTPLIVCTEMPSVVAGWNAVRAVINTSIRTEVSPPWDYICDVAMDATIGVDGSESNATYYADGTHMTFAGDTIFAAYVNNIVKTL